MVPAELEKRATELAGICHRLSGHASYERARMRYAGALLEVARHRPLSVFELTHCGMDYAEAVRVANATKGRRDDLESYRGADGVLRIPDGSDHKPDCLCTLCKQIRLELKKERA